MKSEDQLASWASIDIGLNAGSEETGHDETGDPPEEDEKRRLFQELVSPFFNKESFNSPFDRDFLEGQMFRAFETVEIKPDEIGEFFSNIILLSKNLDIHKYDLILVFKASHNLAVAKFWSELSSEWISRFVPEELEDQEKTKRLKDFYDNILVAISEINFFPTKNLPIEVLKGRVQAMFETYQCLYSLPPDFNKELKDSLVGNLNFLGHATREGKPLLKLLQLFKNNQEVEPSILVNFLDAVCRYGSSHPLDQTGGFQNKMLPAIERQDEQVACLLKPGNTWGMTKGDFGIADFICHCFALEIIPANINELLMAVRETPTTDFAKFEKNRLDGFAVAGTFGALRDFIHDQRPLVHKVLSAMVRYYESGGKDKDELSSLLPKTEGYLGDPERQSLIFDFSLYDKKVKYKTDEEAVIDILRRLVKNSEPTIEIPPKTSDQELNQMMIDSTVGDGRKSLKKLQEVFDRVNVTLLEMIKKHEVGAEPNFVLTMAWLERQGFLALRDLSFEEQVDLFDQEEFYSVLLFQELTASPDDFNQDEFDAFLKNIKKSPSIWSRGVNAEKHRLLSERIKDHIFRLAKKYKQEGKEERIKALWSGNITHELMFLGAFLKPATTDLGKKIRVEAEKDVFDQLSGD